MINLMSNSCSESQLNQVQLNPAKLIRADDFVFERIELSTPAAIAAYERAFYQAFQRVKSQHLIRQLWLWDDAAGRLAARVPYADQVLFAIKTDRGEMDTILAVNVRLRQFQSAFYGFSPPVDGQGCCEIITFFSAGTDRPVISPLFWQWCQQQLAAVGFQTAYATTALRPLKVYRRMGAEVIQEAVIDGETRYFLKFALPIKNSGLV
jgi:hypothetical protein